MKIYFNKQQQNSSSAVELKTTSDPTTCINIEIALSDIVVSLQTVDHVHTIRKKHIF